MPRSQRFENEGTRDFDIGTCATLDDAAYASLQPFIWGGGADKRFFGDGGFFHADRRARFIATTSRAPVNAPDEARPLILNTGRVRDQWHTMHSHRKVGAAGRPSTRARDRTASARRIRARPGRRRHRRSGERMGQERVACPCDRLITHRRGLRAHALDRAGESGGSHQRCSESGGRSPLRASRN